MVRVARHISKFSRQEIAENFKKARCLLKHPGFTILGTPASGDFGKILVITSRKVGKAAKRNRIRRQLKSIFYENKFFEKKINIIIIVKQPALQLSFAELQKLIHKALT